MHTGMLYAALAYIMWGLFPVYFKALQAIPPLEILMHRMLWSLAFVLAVLAVRRQWAWLRPLLRQPKVLAGFALSSILLAINWLLYIWAVNNGHVVDASLGYFINPLVNILLGMMLLNERLRPAQWAAVALAAAGVAWLTWQAGHPPWIGLGLAISFGGYGLLRKTAALGPLEGLTLEALLLFPFALGYLTYLICQRPQLLQRRTGPPAVAADRGRTDHRGAAAAVCRRRAPHSIIAARSAAIPEPDAAIPARRLAVSRTVRRRAHGRFRGNLDGTGAVLGRRLVARLPAARTDGRQQELRRRAQMVNWVPSSITRFGGTR